MTKQLNQQKTKSQSSKELRKHLPLHMIMVLNVLLLALVILIGGIFSYLDIQSGRKMSNSNLIQSEQTLTRIDELVAKQLPLKKYLNKQRLLIADIRNNLDLLMLEENHSFASTEKTYGMLLEQMTKIERAWIPEVQRQKIDELRSRIKSTNSIFADLKKEAAGGNDELHYLAVEMLASISLWIPVIDQIESVLDIHFEKANREILISNRQTTETASALAALFDSFERQYFTTVIIVIAIVAVFQVVFFFILKERLGSVIKITSKITDDGSLSERVNWVSSDEIGFLAQSFNQMLDRLESAHIEISSNKAYLDDIFHSMLNALMVINPDRTIRTVNQSLLTLLKYSESELLGATVDKIFPDHPPNLCSQEHLEAVSQDYIIHGEQHQFHTKEGTMIPVLVSCSKIRDVASKNLGVVCVAQDISQLKQMETDQKRLEEQLRQSQKMEAIGTLAGGIAHDFNNILSTMQGFTWLLLADKPENSEERDYLNEIYMAGERAAGLIQQILTFSRTDGQEQKPLRLSPLVKEALRFMRATIPKSIEIRQEIDPNGLPVLANATQIHQIIINLCTNALHAMKNDEGTLTVSLDQVDESVEHELKEELPGQRFARITVNDTGYGIAPEIKNRIFEPFFTTKEIGEGTGLGLSVVHGIVKNHQGRVFVKSEINQGSTFQVYLPVLEHATLEESEEELIAPAKGHEYIMIVEDEPSLARFYEIALLHLGYKVTRQQNGPRALEFFRNNPGLIDVVYTDQAMPQMTGIQLGKELLSLDPDLPIILCTGYKGDKLKNQAENSGIHYLLEKPVSIGKLTKTIREIFDQVVIKNEDDLDLYGNGTENRPIMLDNAEDIIHRNEEFKDIVPLFLEERLKEVNLVLDAVEKADYEEIYSLGHKMQGASEAFGFTTVSEIGIALKQSAMKGENDLIQDKISKLKDYLRQLENDYNLQ